ncbi:MAG TPA: 16S rRNA (cytidine(1402)-2'-O)-methyltransferase [Vicinamibacterales bacterium]|nr:16S rRNA (cytidine(1402)-2'-O)-methyltransferase [Vicinamibacterales bacterium]
MPGTLYVVATPIGNLEDVTLRALRILREVSLVAAEDTRRTARLLQHYSISTPATSLHEHNEYARTPHLIARLKGGDSIALVSDAGTPGVSDPGARLVQAAHQAGIKVEPIPGPSAVTAMVSACGIGADGFVFAGFAPAKAGQRKRWLAGLADERRAVVFYEAPHRVLATLGDIHLELGDRVVAIGRELTKVHEQLAVRPINAWLADPPPPQGELVMVVYPRTAAMVGDKERPTAAVIASEFGRSAEIEGLTRKEAMRAVADRLGIRVKEVFDALEHVKNSAK